MTETSWWRYIQRHAQKATNAELARMTGLEASAFSRWSKGKPADAQAVVTVARALRRSPVEALAAAGFITEEEAGLREVPADLSDAEPEELFAALQDRLLRRLGETREERLHRPVIEPGRPASERYGLAAKDVDPAGADVAGTDPDVSA